ncbi:hypothetical protein [Halobacillus shinanisalinarum]|nr:hypothetical protein [Halobacillus shinanisalinarum]
MADKPKLSVVISSDKDKLIKNWEAYEKQIREDFDIPKEDSNE